MINSFLLFVLKISEKNLMKNQAIGELQRNYSEIIAVYFSLVEDRWAKISLSEEVLHP